MNLFIKLCILPFAALAVVVIVALIVVRCAFALARRLKK
jgi:hypothetical protein